MSDLQTNAGRELRDWLAERGITAVERISIIEREAFGIAITDMEGLNDPENYAKSAALALTPAASDGSLDVALWSVFDAAMTVLENNYAPDATDLPYDAARWDRMREAINAVYYRPEYARLSESTSEGKTE